MEIRTDALQVGEDGREQLVNVCHTVMVALDRSTMTPAPLPPLVHSSADVYAARRRALASSHAALRRDRQAASMKLRDEGSAPPTSDEMRKIHLLHRRRTAALEDPEEDAQETFALVQDHRYFVKQCIYHEGRNLHGNVFGGYIAREGFGIAFYAARSFLKDIPITLGMDEAVFRKSVEVGDMVRFAAHVVHVVGSVVRVTVLVDVLNEHDPDGGAKRTNRLSFVFLAPDEMRPREVVPVTYEEILLQVDAARWYESDGPSAAFLARLRKGQ